MYICTYMKVSSDQIAWGEDTGTKALFKGMNLSQIPDSLTSSGLTNLAFHSGCDQTHKDYRECHNHL